MYEYILREVTWVLHPRYTQEMLDLILNLGFSKCTSGSLPVADSCESLDSTTPSMGHAASDMAAPLRQLLWQLTPKSDRPYNDTDFNSIHRSGYEPNRFNTIYEGLSKQNIKELGGLINESGIDFIV